MKVSKSEVTASTEIIEVLNAILDVVSYATMIPKEIIMHGGSKQEVAVARQLYCYYAKTHTKATLATIGAMVGRDHATVKHSIVVVNNIIDTKARTYYAWYTRVEKLLFTKLSAIRGRNTRIRELVEGLSHIEDDTAFYEALILFMRKDVEFLKEYKSIHDLQDLHRLGVLKSIKDFLDNDAINNLRI